MSILEEVAVTYLNLDRPVADAMVKLLEHAGVQYEAVNSFMVDAPVSLVHSHNPGHYPAKAVTTITVKG